MKCSMLALRRTWQDVGRIFCFAGGVAISIATLGLARMPAQGLLAGVWWVAIVVVIDTDLKRLIIPDEATLVIAALGLTNAILPALLKGIAFPSIMSGVTVAMGRGALAFGLFWLVGLGYSVVRSRAGLGFGDVKLAGASAIWLPLDDGVLALEIASLAAIFALLLKRRGLPDREAVVPFGAFLAPAAWLVFLTTSSFKVSLAYA